ncbi:MAG: adenosylmethionine decarboxylase [Thermogemmatispora sp.]|jgi:S-adenosylmethionine decarboxylase|uniref:S-adenosylmethionine decarboxylase proenzyme n=5 Tax=Thermogemmatispora TaxID=768669 RepID=A0A328VEE0_9CHLR|nr:MULTISPECIES: adenosylmethionine decarboxylase [Thermogemmatispora]BBH94777.1 adenosylmethionine decarboxylase [Thermogemmatispora argillosa]MBE3565785.1 adenosylmethionine decarboxylase [Thermogemmatispora sp.]MBX5450319.1 adenosylmethionine decarboxylase [Thermogemmatispora sp.]RAQ96046.1 S-adenosylmethionine decarboxylase proenzyme [Thermogemmatispora tikiterensis]GER82325.1 adenosylmethionine decarboxylase [Thermogemmatispora aurantia]
MAPPPVGKHILSELYSCDKNLMAQLDSEKLRAAVSRMTKEHNLTQLGAFCHQFDGGGITCLIALAESHIAIHTWPELGYATLEVYICNYQRDNSDAAERIHAALVSFFEPGKVETRRLAR